MKESVIIPYIKDQLYRNGTYYKMTIYELWSKYNTQRQLGGYAGITYQSFWRYIYVLEQLDLVRKTTPPRGVKRIPKVGGEHPSGFVPKEWERTFIEAVAGSINSYKWNNPWKEYRIIHGSEKYWGSEEAKERRREELAERRAEYKRDHIVRPSTEEYVTIKISKALKKAIDTDRVKIIGGLRTEETINQYLTNHIYKRGRDEDLLITKE